MNKAKVLCAALLLASLSSLARAGDDRIVTVSGNGSVEVAPDVARVNYTVITEGQAKPQGGPLQAGDSVAALVDANNKRVAPAVAYLKGVVGANGTVEAIPNIQRNYEWNQQTQKQEFKGYKVVTTISVKLEGKGPIEQKLGKLFDSSRVSADDIGAPYLGLSEASLVQAQTAAYQKAVANGVTLAKAQLEPGEKLGHAVQRGYRIDVPAPRMEAKAMMAADAPGGAGVGQAIVQTGKVTVNAVINFIFSVQGEPSRLAGTAAESIVSPAQPSGK